MTFRFESPWALALLAVTLLFWFLWPILRRNRPALPFGTAEYAVGLPGTLRLRLQWLLPACAAAAWCCLSIALARPQKGQMQLPQSTEGIAIEMVIDRSGSMSAEMDFLGKTQNRLETVKAIFRDFVLGNRRLGLPGRHNDLIGIVAFASFPYTICPLTLDHDALAFALDGVDFSEDENDVLTAIGDAVVLATARLADAEKTLSRQTGKKASGYSIKSKIIILLTDGQNEGEQTYTMEEAARVAKENGIKIYSIAIVSSSPSYIMTPMGRYLIPPQAYDTSEIQMLADETGGTFQRCEDADGLAGIYSVIDELEKSDIEAARYVTHADLYRPFLLAGLLFALAAAFLKATLCRRAF